MRAPHSLDSVGNTPLHFAVGLGDDGLLETKALYNTMTLKGKNFAIKHKNNSGMTLVDVVAMECDGDKMETLKWLKKIGACGSCVDIDAIINEDKDREAAKDKLKAMQSEMLRARRAGAMQKDVFKAFLSIREDALVSERVG